MEINKTLYQKAGTGAKGTPLTEQQLGEYFPVEIKEKSFRKKADGSLITTVILVAQKIEAKAFPVSRPNTKCNFVNGVNYHENQIEIELPFAYYNFAIGKSEAYTTQVDQVTKASIVMDISNRLVLLREGIADANQQLKTIKDWVVNVAAQQGVTQNQLYQRLRVGEDLTTSIDNALTETKATAAATFSIAAMIKNGKLPSTSVINKSVNDNNFTVYKLYV